MLVFDSLIYVFSLQLLLPHLFAKFAIWTYAFYANDVSTTFSLFEPPQRARVSFLIPLLWTERKAKLQLKLSSFLYVSFVFPFRTFRIGNQRSCVFVRSPFAVCRWALQYFQKLYEMTSWEKKQLRIRGIVFRRRRCQKRKLIFCFARVLIPFYSPLDKVITLITRMSRTDNIIFVLLFSAIYVMQSALPFSFGLFVVRCNCFIWQHFRILRWNSMGSFASEKWFR